MSGPVVAAPSNARMAESIIADFVGTFNAEVMTRPEPVNGRVLLSRKRLVLAANTDEKLTIPLSAIFDIAVGHVPPDLGDFFDSTVTIAFERNDSRYVAAVEADDEKITKFSTVLFKAILNGTEATVTERARVGGRVTNDEFASATLFLHPGSVEFQRPAGSFEIDLETVIGFDRTAREIAGTKRPTLTVRHVVDGAAVTTMAATASPRRMSILGRYLRLEYNELMQDLRDVELTGDEKELLVAMYSVDDLSGTSLANVVGAEGSAVPAMIRRLAEDGLVRDAGDAPALTSKGEVLAGRYLSDVNT